MRDILISKISELKKGIGAGNFDQDSVQLFVKDISKLVPNSKFSDMYFYPEKNRTIEEMADELIKRQEIYERFDESHLNEYIKTEYEKVLNDPNSDLALKYSAMEILSDL